MFAQYFAYFELQHYLWVLSNVVTTLPLAIGGLVLIVAWFRVSLDRSTRLSGMCIILAILIMCCLSWFTWLGFDAAIRFRLFRRERWYESQVQLVQSGGVPGEQNLGCGLSTEVDPGPPVRLAFSWGGGILDNWYGIVFDPTGNVLKVNDATQAREVSMLFGGPMTYAEHVWGPRYFCSFT